MSNFNCHGIKKVLEHKGVELFGSNVRDAEDNFYKYDLVISLHPCHPRNIPVIKGDVYSQGLKSIVSKYGSVTEHINLNWPDYGVPQLSVEFWNDLARYLRKKGNDRARFNKTYKVLVHCMMGHGRSGTALAILASKCDTDNPTSEHLVYAIRQRLCHKCVESTRQIEYISDMVGVKQLDKGSKEGIKPNKAYTSRIIRDSDQLDIKELRRKYDLERDFAIEPPIDLEPRHKTCSTFSHTNDLLNLGYCPGCGEETEAHKIERKAGKFSNKSNSTVTFSSGIGKAITREDIDKRKEVKLIKAKRETE